MKAYVTYDEAGRVSCVAIPNPELSDHLVMAPPEDGSMTVVDTAEVVKGGKAPSFSMVSKRLQEVIHTIAQHRVDPATRRLLPR